MVKLMEKISTQSRCTKINLSEATESLGTSSVARDFFHPQDDYMYHTGNAVHDESLPEQKTNGQK